MTLMDIHLTSQLQLVTSVGKGWYKKDFKSSINVGVSLDLNWNEEFLELESDESSR